MTATKTTSGMGTNTGGRVGEAMGDRMSQSSDQPASMSSTTAQGGQTQGADVVGGHENNSGPGPFVMAAETLEGDSVTNSEGENLGDIKAIMIDVPRGQVAYAVLAFGGFLGMGEKLFAIPWSALTLDADNKCFVLDVEKDRLKQAPGFDKSHWPTMADESWASGIHSFYGRRPYWESRV